MKNQSQKLYILMKKKFEHALDSLPKNFNEEVNILKKNNLNSWESIESLIDKEINKLIIGTKGSTRNLKRIRCIAKLVLKLNIKPGEASILLHSGVPSIEALKSLSPYELIKRAGRLERMHSINRNPVIDISKASSWIKKAKEAK